MLPGGDATASELGPVGPAVALCAPYGATGETLIRAKRGGGWDQAERLITLGSKLDTLGTVLHGEGPWGAACR